MSLSVSRHDFRCRCSSSFTSFITLLPRWIMDEAVLPRRHARLIIVMRLLAKTMSTDLLPFPPPPWVLPHHFRMTDELTHRHIAPLQWFSLGCSGQADEDEAERPWLKDMYMHPKTKCSCQGSREVHICPLHWFTLDYCWLLTPCPT